ncbi:hypothetical protein KAR91_60670 [Candidatus Pacearchaeota archaeon]|nr:hypothetical protein [Candidatus Pacearchaeota archaeon]
MRSRDDDIITLIAITLLGIALILLFFVAALIITSYSPKITGHTVTIVNLDKANYIENTCKLVKVPYKYKVPYEVSRWEEFSRVDYTSDAYKKKVVWYLGNVIDEYVVYIENTGYDDEYFEVKFIFRDYYGAKHSYVVSKYVEAGEGEKFIYRDIYADKDKHHDFSYEVEGESRTYMKEVVNTEYKWKTGYRLERVC